MRTWLMIFITCLLQISTGSGLLSTSTIGIIALNQYNTIVEEKIAEANYVEPEPEIIIPINEPSSFTELDIENFCVIEIPLTHFKNGSGSFSDRTYNWNGYYEGNCKVNFKLKTGVSYTSIEDGHDIIGLGEPVSESEISYGGNMYYYYTYSEGSDGYSKQVWVYVSKDACLIVTFYCDGTESQEEIDEVFGQVLASIDCYYYSGTIADTPTTGYYGTEEDNEEDQNYDVETDENNGEASYEETSSENDDSYEYGEYHEESETYNIYAEDGDFNGDGVVSDAELSRLREMQLMSEEELAEYLASFDDAIEANKNESADSESDGEVADDSDTSSEGTE